MPSPPSQFYESEFGQALDKRWVRLLEMINSIKTLSHTSADWVMSWFHQSHHYYYYYYCCCCCFLNLYAHNLLVMTVFSHGPICVATLTLTVHYRHYISIIHWEMKRLDLDFKILPCFECRMLSSGLFPSVCSLNTSVLEHSVCSIFIGE
jgi:hypothetical protein